MRNKSEVIRQAACGNWINIFESLAPSLKDACSKMPRHVPCPTGTGSKDGFRLFKDANDTGAGVSNNIAVGVLNNGFNVLMWVNGWSFSETLNEVAAQLNINDWQETNRLAPRATVAIKKPTVTKEELYNQRLKLREIWKKSTPINDKKCLLARKYFYSRSIYLSEDEYTQLAKTMRFHPNLEYWHDEKLIGKYPAIVTLVKYEDGSPASLHRTYLNDKGKKLSLNVDDEVLPNKKLMAKCEDRMLSGGAIQLFSPTSTTLDISEGIETGLAVQTVINRPVWPCVSAVLLANFNPPKGVTTVNVWGDLDISNAGLLAAEMLKERMQEKNVKVNIILPNEEIPSGEKGIDWNDVLASMGKSHFPEIYYR